MEGHVYCEYQNKECCFRNTFGICEVLNNTYFSDSECHFRKKTPDGENLYDLEKKRKDKIAV